MVVLQVQAGIVRLLQVRGIFVLVHLHVEGGFGRRRGRPGNRSHGFFGLGHLDVQGHPTVLGLAGLRRLQGQVYGAARRRFVRGAGGIFGSRFRAGVLFLLLPLEAPRSVKLLRGLARQRLSPPAGLLALLQVTEGDHAAHPRHRARADIRQEAHGHGQQDEPHAGRAHLRRQPVAHVVSVQAAQVDKRIPVDILESEAEKHGEPDQQHEADDEPPPQAHAAHLHQPKADRPQEDDDEERGHAEAVVDEVAGQLGPAGPGIVLHAIVHRGQLGLRGVVDDALVGRAGEEERRESQQQVDREDDDQQAADEAHGLAPKNACHLVPKGHQQDFILTCSFLFH